MKCYLPVLVGRAHFSFDGILKLMYQLAQHRYKLTHCWFAAQNYRVSWRHSFCMFFFLFTHSVSSLAIKHWYWTHGYSPTPAAGLSLPSRLSSSESSRSVVLLGAPSIGCVSCRPRLVMSWEFSTPGQSALVVAVANYLLGWVTVKKTI